MAGGAVAYVGTSPVGSVARCACSRTAGAAEVDTLECTPRMRGAAVTLLLSVLFCLWSWARVEPPTSKLLPMLLVAGVVA